MLVSELIRCLQTVMDGEGDLPVLVEAEDESRHEVEFVVQGLATIVLWTEEPGDVEVDRG